MPDTTAPPSTAQQRFDEAYITSVEVCRRVGVSRTTVLSAVRRRLLPDPVKVGGILYVWERKAVEPNLDAWALLLNVRRSNSTQGAAIA